MAVVMDEWWEMLWDVWMGKQKAVMSEMKKDSLMGATAVGSMAVNWGIEMGRAMVSKMAKLKENLSVGLWVH